MPARPVRTRVLALVVAAGFAFVAAPPVVANAQPAGVVAPAVKKVTKKASMTMGCKTFSTTVAWATTASTTYAKVAKGKSSAVKITFAPNYRTGPVPITANSLKPVLYLTVNGKAKSVVGSANPVAVGPNTTLPASKIGFSFKVKKGKNTIVLNKIVWDHAVVDTTCSLTKPVSLASFTAK